MCEKLKAAILLLSIMTDLLIENVDNYLDIAEEHRRRFKKKASDEVFSAGMEIVKELAHAE